MIAVDTNVLVRYLTQDDPRQSAEASGFIDGVVGRGEMLFVSQIVLCELVWVLSYAYDVRRAEIAAILHQLRRASHVVVESPDEVQRAAESYEHGKGDFSDYLIAERAATQGCSPIVTFDRALLSDTRFTRPSGVRAQ